MWALFLSIATKNVHSLWFQEKKETLGPGIHREDFDWPEWVTCSSLNQELWPRKNSDQSKSYAHQPHPSSGGWACTVDLMAWKTGGFPGESNAGQVKITGDCFKDPNWARIWLLLFLHCQAISSSTYNWIVDPGTVYTVVTTRFFSPLFCFIHESIEL